MNPPIQAVIFDIGGVFFPWPQPAFFQQWEVRLGIPPGQLHSVLWYGPDIEAANIGAITAEAYFQRCAKRLDTDEVLVKALIEGTFAGEVLNDELVTYTRKLRTCVRVAVLTNNWSFGRKLIQQRGINDLFDLVVVSAEEGVKKPNPRIYEIMLERLALPAAEVVFVDDSEENVIAAQALSIRSILFRSTGQTIGELEGILV